LFEFESAVRVVAVAALHHSFENLVMKRFIEVGLHLTVTADTKMWLANRE
jgi:hypothetical protein